ARVGQYPDLHALERIGLPAQAGDRTVERTPKGLDTEHGQSTRPMARELAPELAAAARELVGPELGRRARRAIHEIRDAAAVCEQAVLFEGRQLPLGETRAVKSGPEPVAGTPEVTANRRGVQAGVDATEQD